MKSRALYLEKLIDDDKDIGLEENSFLSEEEYKNIIELSSVGIFICNTHGKIISWNHAMEKLTEIKDSEAIGSYVWEILYKLTPIEYKNPEFLIVLENKLMSNIHEWPYWKRQVSEQRLTSLSGSDITAKVSSFVTASQDGNLLVTVIRDISTQKQVEKTLSTQIEALSKLNKFSIELSRLKLEDNMEELITKRIKDFTGAIGAIFSEYNPETRTLTPKHMELEAGILEILVNLLDKHVHKIHSELSDFMYYELTANMIGTGKSLTEVSLGAIPQSVGATAQVLLMADRFIRVAYLVEGKLYGTSLLALGKNQPDPPMEILENFVCLAAASLRHKRTEQALWKSEEMLRTVTDNAADIILKLDDEGTILYTSRAFSGYKKEEVIGKNFCEWTAPEFHDLMKQSLEIVFSDAIPQTYQSRALGNNHEIRWHLSRITPVIVDQVVKNAVLIISDITERKQAEEALRESEENYRIITQSTLDIVFIIDRSGKQLFLNSSIEKILGYKVEDVIGRSISELIPEQSFSDFHKQLENVFLFKESCNFASVMYHCDGYLVDVEINARLVKLKGEYVSLGTIRDITAKKRAEAELKNSLVRNKALLEAIPDLMFVFNSKCKIVDFHSESHNQLLIDPDLFLGKLIDDILPHEVVITTHQKVERVLATGKSEYSTYQLKIGDDLKYFESRYVPCGNNEVLSIVRDITEQKNAEKALNISKESYLDIFNSVTEAIYILDENGKFLDVNKGAEKMYQMDKLEFIGHSLTMLAAPDFNDMNVIEQKMVKVLETGDSVSFDFWAENKSRGVFLNEVIVNKGRYFGKDVLIAAARDITDKKKEEEQIRLKNDELINLNAEKDKFFSIIAHDLRSPLVSFLGLTQIMAEELSSLTINEIQEMATGMKRSADSLFGLLENLLEWSRLQRGLIRYSPTKFLLKKKVSETMKAVLESATIKEIEISYQIPEDMEVFADENMIASTIRNLASNALKFTPKGGKVSLSARYTAGNEIEFSVKDSGIGMDKNIIDNLFVIDGHTNRQGTDGEPSSGLGLIICKDFISRHGGKLWVESEEGKGSTFYFTLPGEITPIAE
jgi:PAS domain S-box-containing protein